MRFIFKDVLEGRDALLLRDSLVLSRNALSLGAALVKQLWQRLMPRADAESSPAARRLDRLLARGTLAASTLLLPRLGACGEAFAEAVRDAEAEAEGE